ncbi:MAG: ABC transporter substrate-binding protein [Anaerolineae bacterium]
MKWVGGAVVLVILLFLSACTGNSTSISPTVDPTLQPTPDLTTPIPSVATLPSTSPTFIPTQQAATNITLTVWAPEEFTPEAARGGQVLERQLAEFTQAHPNIRVSFVLKSPYGKGGLLDFMLKVQALVPARLPDLIIIDSKQVDAAAKADFLQPLSQDLPAGAMADLFPPAQKMARYNGDWLVLPITLDVQHLAYHKQVVHGPLGSWDQVLAAKAPFAFPADDDDAFLFQYLQNHGRLSAAEHPGPLDAAVIMTVLTFFQQLRAANLAPDNTLSIKSTHDVWPLFADGQAALAQVEASDYLTGASRIADASFAPLPTQDGKTTTLVSSWNYAIVTSDPQRHAAAAELLNWLNEPARMAEWAAAAGMVPARRSAFVSSVPVPEYADFLRGLIESGIVAPTLAERAPYATGWHTGLQAVLRGQSTPAEAAPKAAQAVTP